MTTKKTLLLTGREPYVLRDGRPFGSSGQIVGGSLPWPMPSTLAGMVRSAIGSRRPPPPNGQSYFDRDAGKDGRMNELLKVRLDWILPMLRANPNPTTPWRRLFPAPADAAIFPEAEDTIRITPFKGLCVREDEGCLGRGASWILPETDSAKPASGCPSFWHEDRLMEWLQEQPVKAKKLNQLGPKNPQKDTRIHTAINPHTFSVDSGKLFESPGIRLGHPDYPKGEFGIAIGISGLEEKDAMDTGVYLGGDRRVAACMDGSSVVFPSISAELSAVLSKQRFLRLILVTPGSFGGWAPEWLKPEAIIEKEAPWVDLPGSPIKVRLRSAFVPGWMPLSGWDMLKRGAKAMRKIVPAGSVYVVELENPADAGGAAAHLWGRSLCTDEQAARDGFGVALVGGADQFCQTALVQGSKE